VNEEPWPLGVGGTGSCAGGCTGSGASGTGASGGGISGFGIGCAGTSRCGGCGAGESGPGLSGWVSGCSGDGVGDSGLPGTGGVTCICVLTSATCTGRAAVRANNVIGSIEGPYGPALDVPMHFSATTFYFYGVFSAPFFSDFIIA
jgi:hypothetical protein